MAASDEKLGQLHELVTDALITMVKGQEIPYEDEESGETVVNVIPPSAAIIQAAAKFLSDNKITCAPTKDNKLGELEAAMAKRDEARKARRAQSADFDAATEAADFMGGLQ